MPSSGQGPRHFHRTQRPAGAGLLKYHILPSFREPHNQFGKYPTLKKKEVLSDKLPVEEFKQEILRAIKLSDIVIIQAETGAGKSTMVPQFLAEAGYSVQVTQPRRMAAESLANYLASQRGTQLGDDVSFQHGLRQVCNSESQINFLTDGFRLAQELGGARQPQENEVLILDEAHEKNIYMETLLALHKMKSKDPNKVTPKLIVMSATMNTKKLSEYLGKNIPVIKIPGRTFPVRRRKPTKSIITDVIASVKKKENILIFLPGKSEIAQLRGRLEGSLRQNNLPVVILPLHSGLSSSQQQKCLDRYDVPKIILATNVAEASITVPDIDHVIITGLVKRITIEKAVECLTLMPISKFNEAQQKGRAGRTKKGFVTYRGATPISALEEESPADIQNSKVEKLILTLLGSPDFTCRESIERIEFLHPIPPESLDDAFKTLQKLNLVGPRGHITNEGQAVASLPVSVAVGKVLTTAHQKALAWRDENILHYVIDVAAVLTNGAIGKRDYKSTWAPYCADETESDALAQALLLQQARHLPNDQLLEHGFDRVAVGRSRDLRRLLLKRFRVEDQPGYMVDDLTRQAVLESLWSGMSNVVFKLKATHEGKKYGVLGSRNSDYRRLDSSSVLDSESSELVVGLPFDIFSYTDPDHPKTDRLIHMATRIDAGWVRNHSRSKAKALPAQKSQKNSKNGDRFRNQSIKRRN